MLYLECWYCHFFPLLEHSKYFSYLHLVVETYFPKVIANCGNMKYKMLKSTYLGMYLFSMMGKEHFIFLKWFVMDVHTCTWCVCVRACPHAYMCAHWCACAYYSKEQGE